MIKILKIILKVDFKMNIFNNKTDLDMIFKLLLFFFVMFKYFLCFISKQLS